MSARKAALSGLPRQVVDFTLSTRDLSVGLLRGGQAFIMIALAASRVHIAVGTQHTRVELSLGAISIDDLLCATGLYSRILGTQASHTIELSVDTYTADGVAFPGHELAVVARVSSIQFIVVAPVLRDLASYFSGERTDGQHCSFFVFFASVLFLGFRCLRQEMGTRVGRDEGSAASQGWQRGHQCGAHNSAYRIGSGNSVFGDCSAGPLDGRSLF